MTYRNLRFGAAGVNLTALNNFICIGFQNVNKREKNRE